MNKGTEKNTNAKREKQMHELWNERGYDKPYLSKLNDKDLDVLWATEFYHEKMVTGGKVNDWYSKLKEGAKSTYSKGKAYTQKQVHDLKKKVAIDVLEDTKKKTPKTERNVITNAKRILVKRYETGGGVDEKVIFNLDTCEIRYKGVKDKAENWVEYKGTMMNRLGYSIDGKNFKTVKAMKEYYKNRIDNKMSTGGGVGEHTNPTLNDMFTITVEGDIKTQPNNSYIWEDEYKPVYQNDLIELRVYESSLREGAYDVTIISRNKFWWEFPLKDMRKRSKPYVDEIKSQVNSLLEKEGIKLKSLKMYSGRASMETGGKVDEVITINVDNYPYYLKKEGDTTHFRMANSKEGVSIVIPSHIGQHRDEPYYSDISSWLKGGANPDGKSYTGSNYAHGGSMYANGGVIEKELSDLEFSLKATENSLKWVQQQTSVTNQFYKRKVQNGKMTRERARKLMDEASVSWAKQREEEREKIKNIKAKIERLMALRDKISKSEYATGGNITDGVVGQEILFDYMGEEKTGVIREVTNSGDYVVNSDDGRTLLAQVDRDVLELRGMRKKAAPQMPRKLFGFFGEGGNIDEIEYSSDIATTWMEESVITDDLKKYIVECYMTGGEELANSVVLAIQRAISEGGSYITEMEITSDEEDTDKPKILVELYNALQKAKNLVSLEWGYDEDGYNINYKSGLESESDYHKGELESYTFYVDENDSDAIEAVYDLSGNSVTSLTIKQVLNSSRANEVDGIKPVVGSQFTPIEQKWTKDDQNALEGLISDIETGIGWISPDYVEESWTSRRGNVGTRDWNPAIARRVYQEMIDSDILYADDENEAGEKIYTVSEAIQYAQEMG